MSIGLLNCGPRASRVHATTERGGVITPLCGGGRGARGANYQTDCAGIVTCQACLALLNRPTPPQLQLLSQH